MKSFGAVGAVVATSAMLFWGTGLHPIWWLTWFAPLPVLLVSPRLGGWLAFGATALSWFLGSLNMWRYMLTNFTPLPLLLVFSIVPACLFGVAVLLFRGFILRGDQWKAVLAFPTFWVTLEYLNNTTSVHGTFSNLGYTQMDCLPVLQVASVLGIWGISFCLLLLPATIAATLGGYGSARERTRIAIVVAVILGAVVGFGSWRLISTPRPERSIKVALMTTGVDTPFPRDDSTALTLLRNYSEKAASLAAQGAQVIVLPEKIALVSDQATSQVDALFATASAGTNASLIVGLDRGTLTRRFNEARVYIPGSTSVASYYKHHLLPPFENVDQPGIALTVLDQPSGVWGIEICKDMDFPRLSREYSAKGVGLLLVPAWDFTLDGWLHGRMAVMRGVESGFTIARSAKQGLLTVSDDRGRILAQQDAATVHFASLLATAPVRHDDTLYARWGDWFAWLNIAGLIVILLSLTRKHEPRSA
jgi:apolipoprotein N-acyltransferase